MLLTVLRPDSSLIEPAPVRGRFRDGSDDPLALVVGIGVVDSLIRPASGSEGVVGKPSQKVSATRECRYTKDASSISTNCTTDTKVSALFLSVILHGVIINSTLAVTHACH